MRRCWGIVSSWLALLVYKVRIEEPQFLFSQERLCSFLGSVRGKVSVYSMFQTVVELFFT